MTTLYRIELFTQEMYLDIKIQHPTGTYYKAFNYVKGYDHIGIWSWYTSGADWIVYESLDRCKNDIYDGKCTV